MESVVSLQYLRPFYEGKKVFLTGHTGFKGSWMLIMLHALGAQVKGYSLAANSSKDLYQLLDKNPAYGESIIADIRDRERLRQEVQSFEPDYIFHLAAQPLVLASYQAPADTFETNVVGTANLLEAAIGLKKACRIVVITTDKVYENKEQHHHYTETDVLGGYDPYSASKACTELVVNSFRNSFFNTEKLDEHRIAVASARAGNVIGGGDWAENRIVPDIARSLLKQETIVLRNPLAIRPWQHVMEPLGGYLLLGVRLSQEPKRHSKAYNFGPVPEDHLTVEELTKVAIQHWGSGQYLIEGKHDKPHEAGLLKLNISAAENELGWIPKYRASEAIRLSAEWYQHSDDLLTLSSQQVAAYLQ